MKYAVAQCANGNFSIVSEWTDRDRAILNFHSACTTLWNAPDVEHAVVAVIDEKFLTHKIELIKYNEFDSQSK